MSTGPSPLLTQALAGAPKDFGRRLVEAHASVRAAFSDGNFDNVGQRTGFFCEIALRLLQQQLTGSHVPFGSKIRNFGAECNKLAQTPSAAGPETLRLIVPKALEFLYTMRNKRGIGHVGGDVDANSIDAATYTRVCDWCMAELIRVFHGLSLEEAQAVLDALASRQHPHVWNIAGRKRLLATHHSYKDQVLLLLHSQDDGLATVEELCEWTEHSRLADFRRRVLMPLHQARLVEYDTPNEVVLLSPLGSKRVEEVLLPTAKTA